MAGSDPRWCSRELMWMVFDYSFNQLGVRKVLALVRSTNEIALDQDMRAGFKLEAIIREVYPDADMWVLGMTRAQCRWLALKPKHHRIERAA
jgi:RimJ/RimL family protein N-acetyltransferase